LNVVFVTPEIAPFSKTGGLADVSAALPQALGRLGHRVWIVTPLYQGVKRSELRRRVAGLEVLLGGDRLLADVWEASDGSVTTLLLDPPGFFERTYLYGPPEGEYSDNAYRFAFLARGAIEVCTTLGIAADVFHAHDWQGGLVPLYLRRDLADGPLGGAACVFTIHNMGYQGLFPREVLEILDLGDDLWSPASLEFWGRLSYLKAGILFADRLSTVSPTYAQEIQTPEFGCGLEGLVRARAPVLEGILNGIDVESWDPARDPHLSAAFDASSLGGKAACKAALQRRLGLQSTPRTPLVVTISRLVAQKGWDLFAPIADPFLAEDVQLAVLGTGAPHFEGFFRGLEARYPGRVAATIGFDEALAHQMEAGADLFLMPSWYEPCGLNQMYSQRYGTLPIVRPTGGLEDTVVDVDEDPPHGTGFKFRHPWPGALLDTLRRALGRYRDRDAWREIMRRAMAIDFSWERAARAYARLYDQAIEDRR
jgi:starch synthase